MVPGSIVEGLDPVEDGCGQLHAGLPFLGVEQFGLHARPEGLHRGVVVGWQFNVRYVDDGVRRFLDLEWQYGKDVATGAMVGYVESLTPEEIIVEVNGALDRLGVSALTLPPRIGSPLIEMEHSFDRPFEISPFQLVHLWTDIRPVG